ncbi:MAG TPA: phosphodiester glycosidase family protein [Puia sp.]|nr:phosphodiester glycosidase family protein [Puia sp.]
MPKPVAFCLLYLLSFRPCLGQLRWQRVDSAYGPLPSSMHVYRSTDSLDGFPSVAYYVSARLKDKNIQFTATTGQGKRFTPQQYYQIEQFPLLVVNCTFFSFANNQNFNLVVKDGKMQAYNVTSLRGTGNDSLLFYYPTRGAIGIDRKRRADVAWTFTDSSRRWPYAFEEMPVIARGTDTVPSIYDLNDIEWKWWKMRTAVGGGPVLIHDGKIHITDVEEQLFPGSNRNGERLPRTAMGYTRDGRLIILVVQGRAPGVAAGATLQQEAQLLYRLGCYEALNLDGGGSTCMLVNGRETIRPSDRDGERPVPAVFLIKRTKQ